jgi:IS5 family transposase
MTQWIAHRHAEELAAMSALLDEQPALTALVRQDLEAGCPKNPHTGRSGVTDEQTARVIVLRQLTGWTYAELAFHLADSATYRAFCRIDALTKAPSKSALAAAVERVQPATLAAMNAHLVTSAAARKVEPGRTVRMDATAVPATLHHPTDSALLWDAVRVLDRLLLRMNRVAGFTAYHRHIKRAKRRAWEIADLAPQQVARRQACYRELLDLAQATVSYATCALAHVEGLSAAEVTPTQVDVRDEIAALLPLVAQVMDQTERRVFQDEAVPADEKLVSLFEAHVDVIVKDRRETYYGHKVYLTTGRSGLIVDCAIPKGNPADSTWTVPLVRRQVKLYGQAPRQVSFDGAFASTDNLAACKALGVKDVCFAKKRGLAVRHMVRSEWVYDKLRRFRAGIEAGISLLKRVFGLARCVWKARRASTRMCARRSWPPTSSCSRARVFPNSTSSIARRALPAGSRGRWGRRVSRAHVILARRATIFAALCDLARLQPISRADILFHIPRNHTVSGRTLTNVGGTRFTDERVWGDLLLL